MFLLLSFFFAFGISSGFGVPYNIFWILLVLAQNCKLFLVCKKQMYVHNIDSKLRFIAVNKLRRCLFFRYAF